MEIKVKLLNETAKLPQFMNVDDAGADIVATSKKIECDKIIYGTGIAFDIPKGYYIELHPRSSIHKYDLSLANSTGIIDAGYKDEVSFIFKLLFTDNVADIYEVGDRIGQAILRKCVKTEYVVVDEINKDNDRGGGIGSTGK